MGEWGRGQPRALGMFSAGLYQWKAELEEKQWSGAGEQLPGPASLLPAAAGRNEVALSTLMRLLRVTGMEANCNQLAGNQVYMQQGMFPMQTAQSQHPWSPCAPIGMGGCSAQGTANANFAHE